MLSEKERIPFFEENSVWLSFCPYIVCFCDMYFLNIDAIRE